MEVGLLKLKLSSNKSKLTSGFIRDNSISLLGDRCFWTPLDLEFATRFTSWVTITWITYCTNCLCIGIATIGEWEQPELLHILPLCPTYVETYSCDVSPNLHWGIFFWWKETLKYNWNHIFQIATDQYERLLNKSISIKYPKTRWLIASRAFFPVMRVRHSLPVIPIDVKMFLVSVGLPHFNTISHMQGVRGGGGDGNVACQWICHDKGRNMDNIK